MRTKLYKIAQAATLGIAMSLITACPEPAPDDDYENSSSSGKPSIIPSSSSGEGISSSAKNPSSSSIGNTPSSSSVKSSSSGVALSSSQGNSTESGSFIDSRDGKEYKTVVIGTQTWMAQNLDYKETPVNPDPASKRGSKCYDNKESNCDKYGRLYEWYVAIEVCPDGWHLPARSEWNTLVSYVGTNPGTKLKAISNDWRDGSGTDNYGFGALPGGTLIGEFENINIAGYWWTATEATDYNINRANRVSMDGGNGVDVGIGPYPYKQALKNTPLSIRCVLGISSSSSITYGEIDDKRDGKKYRTVKIATQNWMAENLNYETNDSQCYNDKENNCKIYGRLYNWESATTACPTGWKLPTRSEWNALISYIGDYPGKKLKAKNGIWGDNYGTNDYGFEALPGGILIDEFENINTAGYWWTATEATDYNINRANRVSMDNEDDVDVGIGPYPYKQSFKVNKLSIRCVED